MPVLPDYIEAGCARLREKGYKAHPVGGCVRDLLLGRQPEDWDVATSARPEEVMALFGRTVPTGIRHGTVTVLLDGGRAEVTTFRREEGYADGRHPGRVLFDADSPRICPGETLP
jgi:tRNA nucleotidyltransferase (CCA-adding enzyme)